QNALRWDNKNVQYHLDMAKLLLRKNMKPAAKSRLKKVIKLDPGNAEAYFQLGLLKEDEMLWYKDLISPQEYTVFYFDDYAREDMREAERYFNKALMLDPNFAAAYYHLALIQYELADYQAMAKLLQKALNIQPDNKDFYLFAGLAFHRMGQFDSASKYFTQAANHMSNEERNLLESIEPLLNPAMQEQYTQLSSNDRNHFEQQFWKQRDPLFITEFNERLLEHFSRFAYANLRFGKPDKGIAGWTTNQGKAYIRFGAPKVMYRTRPTLEFTLGSKRNPVVPSQEYWDYQNFHLIFEDEYLSGQYKFKRSFYPEYDTKYVYEKLINDVPEYYEPDFGGSQFEIPRVLAQFKGAADSTKMELYYGMPNDQITFDGTKVLLKRGLFVFDDHWNDISRKVENRRVTLAGLNDDSTPLFWVDRQQLQLTPGRYHIALELVDEKSGNVGRYRDELIVRAFDQSGLDMSDVLIAVKIENNAQLPVYSMGNLKVIPSLFHTFKPIQPIFVYFEIYNLQLNEDAGSHYRVETRLRPVKKNKPALAKFASGVGQLFGFKKSQQTEVSTSFEYFGNSSTERVHSAVQLADAKPGSYLLTIRSTDMNSGNSIEKDITFAIIN
ncbi:MAG: GWxTD domain-containing protein, partial [bacterium]